MSLKGLFLGEIVANLYFFGGRLPNCCAALIQKFISVGTTSECRE